MEKESKNINYKVIDNFTIMDDTNLKRDILGWFYPKLKINQKLIIDNSNEKIIKLMKKNKNIRNLVNTLDLIEI